MTSTGAAHHTPELLAPHYSRYSGDMQLVSLPCVLNLLLTRCCNARGDCRLTSKDGDFQRDVNRRLPFRCLS